MRLGAKSSRKPICYRKGLLNNRNTSAINEITEIYSTKIHMTFICMQTKLELWDEMMGQLQYM